MITLKTDKKRLALLIALVCASSWAEADESIEFNTDVLDASDRQNVDLQRFSEGNFVTPGEYLLDVRINSQEIPQQSIRYIVDPANSHKSMACLTPQQLELLALKEEALTYIHPISATCYDISRLPGVALNNSAGVLDITVPQAWMKYTDPDWTPPERWDNGVAGLIFDYSVSGQATHYEQGGDHYRSLSGYGQTGFNLGAWRFRGQYQANYASDENRGRIDWDQIYAYRPLPMQAAKLTVGEIYLNSQVFDSVRFTGANLASDERMLPPNLQGYAPEVHGIARSNAWSLYGGALLTGDRYNAWSMGIGRDLSWLGALSADATQSVSRVKHQTEQKGMSFKLSYAKTFDEYNSAITFAGYRFSQRNFRTFSQFLDEQYENNNSAGNEKEMYTITGNKTFFADDPQLATTLYLTYTHQNYWDRGSQDRYGLSMGHSFSFAGIQGISANLAAYRSEYQGKRDDSLSLSISVPWSDGRSMDYEVQNSGSQTSQMVSYSDNRDRNNPWRLRAGVSGEGHTAFDGYYKHRSMMAELESNVSWQQSRYFSVGGTMRGGFTATRHGAALHNSQASMNTARVMVDTDGVANVPLNGEQAHSNRFGIAVVPDVVSYHSFDTRIDVDAMDEDISATKAIVTNTLTEGAIGYQRFAVAQGQKMMALLRLKDGSVPPFGAEVFNANGVSVAMVMENGMAWIAGVNPAERLSVAWGGRAQCHLQVPQQINPEGNVLLPCE